MARKIHLTWDIGTGKLEPLAPTTSDSLYLKRWENVTLVVTVTDEGATATMPSGAGATLKQVNRYDVVLAAWTPFTLVSGNTYSATTQLNADTINTLLGTDVDLQSCQLDFAATGYEESATLAIDLRANIRRDTDGTPSTVFSRGDFLVSAGTGLSVNIAAGITGGASIAAQGVEIADNATNYVEVTGAGVASVNQSGFNSSNLQLAKVVAAFGVITTVTDVRGWVTGGSSGGANIVTPGVAHFTTDGGATGADGSLAKPYGAGQLQAAYDAGFKTFNVGPGVEVGDLTIPNGETQYLTFNSESNSQDNGGNSVVGNVICYEGTTTILCNGDLVFQSIDASSQTDSPSASGGTVELIGQGLHATAVSANGFSSPAGGGSNGGVVYVNSGSAGTINVNGGASNDGVTAGGSGGDVYLYNFSGDLPTINNAGGAGNGASDGLAGKVLANMPYLSSGSGAISFFVRADSGNGIQPFTFALPNGVIVLQGSALGQPASGNLASCSGYRVNNLANAGTGVVAALLVATGSAGSFVVNGGAGGTPSSITLTNASGTAASLTAGTVTSIGNLTGDVTSSNRATTLATVNSNVGTFGGATSSASINADAKGRILGITATAITPSLSSVTGISASAKTALANATGTTGGLVTYSGHGGNFIVDSLDAGGVGVGGNIFLWDASGRSHAANIRYSSSANDPIFNFPDISSSGTVITTANFSDLTPFTGSINFTRAGTASNPTLKVTGAPATGTGTTAQSLVYIGDGAASGTWGVSGTYLGINANGTSADVMNCMSNGTSIMKLSGLGALTLSNGFVVSRAQNANTLCQIANTNSSAAAAAVIQFTNDAGNCYVGISNSTGVSGFEANKNRLYVDSFDRDGLSLTARSSGDIRFYTAGPATANERGRISNAGGFSWGSTTDPGAGNVFFANDLRLGKTVTASGTTGAQTINKTSGSVNFAAAATSLVVTNSLVTTSSIIICTVATNDATMFGVKAVAAAGSFTLYANAAPTAETRVNFKVTN
jgi:hypothetical protein